MAATSSVTISPFNRNPSMPRSEASSSSAPLAPCGKSQIHRIHKDAESVLHRSYRPLLARQLSAPELGKGHERLMYQMKKGKLTLSQQERQKKSGHFWKYVDRKPNRLGGFIDVFKIKQEFDDVTPENPMTRAQHTTDALYANLSICFPAFEDTPQAIMNMEIKSEESSDPLFANGELVLGSVFKRLGCSYQRTEKEFFLNFPDHEALLANWEGLRETCPALFPIEIFSSQGSESDLDFFHLSIAYDAIYSSKKEACHDFQSHITEIISMIVDMINRAPSQDAGKEYAQLRYGIAKAMLIPYRRIMLTEKLLNQGLVSIPESRDLLKKLQVNLGAFADVLPMAKDYEKTIATGLPLHSFASTHFQTPLINQTWRSYWNRKRKELGSFDFRLLLKLWGEMDAIEITFDQTRLG